MLTLIFHRWKNACLERVKNLELDSHGSIEPKQDLDDIQLACGKSVHSPHVPYTRMPRTINNTNKNLRAQCIQICICALFLLRPSSSMQA